MIQKQSVNSKAGNDGHLYTCDATKLGLCGFSNLQIDAAPIATHGGVGAQSSASRRWVEHTASVHRGSIRLRQQLFELKA
jgi:hypothetical protein